MNRLISVVVSQILLAVSVLALSPQFALAKAKTPAAPDSSGQALFGQWWTPGFGSRVEFARCEDSSICGRIVWLWDPRVAPLGQVVLSGFKPTSPGHWGQGQAFNPVDGNTYRATINLMPAHRLKVRGCVLFFCKEQVWIRVNSLDTVPRRAQIR